MWDVRTRDGERVSDLAGLADALGCDEAKAAVDLLASPFVDLAPLMLLGQAQAKAGALPDEPPLFAEVDLFALAAEEKALDLFADPEGKGAHPFEKVKKNPKEFGEGKATVKRGAFVKWGNKRGRVDLIVEGGVVPGVDGDKPVFGSKTGPAARVVVYVKDGDGWKASDEKVAVKASDLTEIDALPKKGAKAERKADAVLVRLLAERSTPLPATAVKAAYERGLDGWPGPSATRLTRDGWALGRATALLDAAEGKVLPGFADGDLL